MLQADPGPEREGPHRGQAQRAQEEGGQGTREFGEVLNVQGCEDNLSDVAPKVYRSNTGSAILVGRRRKPA